MKNRVLLSFLLLPFFTLGGGFEINRQGQKANGMAGAFAGVANDASAIYYNPAAIAFHEHAMMNAGYDLVFPRVSFLSPSEGNVDSKTTLMVPFHVYATHHFANRKVTGGIGIYTPYGTSTKWEDKWTGRYLTQQTKLTTIFLQPTITYRLDDNYSAGIGLIGATGFLKMRRALPVNDDVELDLKGTGLGYGFNIGAFAHFEKLNFSINYRSAVKLKTSKGDATFNNIPSSFIDQQTYPESASFKSSFKLPSTFTFGIGYLPTERIITDIDISYTTWKDFTDWNIEISDYDQLNSINNRNFSNTFSIRLGGQYRWSDKMDYRIGANYEQSPSSDNHLYPDLAGGVKLGAAAGATRHVRENIGFDISLMIEDFSEQKENANEKNFNGAYSKTVYSIGLGVNYEF